MLGKRKRAERSEAALRMEKEMRSSVILYVKQGVPCYQIPDLLFDNLWTKDRKRNADEAETRNHVARLYQLAQTSAHEEITQSSLFVHSVLVEIEKTHQGYQEMFWSIIEPSFPSIPKIEQFVEKLKAKCKHNGWWKQAWDKQLQTWKPCMEKEQMLTLERRRLELCMQNVFTYFYAVLCDMGSNERFITILEASERHQAWGEQVNRQWKEDSVSLIEYPAVFADREFKLHIDLGLYSATFTPHNTDSNECRLRGDKAGFGREASIFYLPSLENPFRIKMDCTESYAYVTKLRDMLLSILLFELAHIVFLYVFQKPKRVAPTVKK
jgi:hypothetical protein